MKISCIFLYCPQFKDYNSSINILLINRLEDRVNKTRSTFEKVHLGTEEKQRRGVQITQEVTVKTTFTPYFKGQRRWLTVHLISPYSPLLSLNNRLETNKIHFCPLRLPLSALNTHPVLR